MIPPGIPPKGCFGELSQTGGHVKQPPDVRALFAQAVGHHQAGRLDEAVACYRQVLLFEPDMAPAHSNLGTALCDLGLLEEAEASYRKALALRPDQAEAHNNLGTVLFEREKLDEAVSCYREALALKPDYAEALNNLGAALHRRGEIKEAEANIRCALALAPDYAQALSNLGAFLKAHGQFEEAETVYRRLTIIRPEDCEGLNGLAEILAVQDDAMAAVETILQSLCIKDTGDARRIFAEIVKPLRWAGDNPYLRNVMLRAVTESWARPEELSHTAASLIKQRPETGACIFRAATAWPQTLTAPELFGPGDAAALAHDELLCAVLTAMQNTDIEIERFLTMARHALLETAGDATDDTAIEFHAALTRQCFINEYVFFCSEEEIGRASKRRDALARMLDAGAPISVPHMLAVASYFPLGSIPGADKLLDLPWPEPVAAMLTQQLREPQEEARLRASIPALTGIENAVSQLNRKQYEENPYPRWVRIPRQEQQGTLAGYLRKRFPLADFKQNNGSGPVDILSAGCGTGRLALEIAQGIKSRVLAVDLSIESLGYAKRKAQELELNWIEFAQADLLELGGIGRTFDVVECSGVLHHLADPFAGWRTLLPLVRPGGFMTIGLYSETARKGIVRAQLLAAQQGYDISADGIRRCRQDLLDSDEGQSLGIASASDFFGISSCRDLLFHVQESRTRLPAVAAFLRDNHLTFLGFEIDAATLRAYRRRFPDDPAATDLHHWHAFESERPDSFAGMYRFWLQKA